MSLFEKNDAQSSGLESFYPYFKCIVSLKNPRKVCLLHNKTHGIFEKYQSSSRSLLLAVDSGACAVLLLVDLSFVFNDIILCWLEKFVGVKVTAPAWLRSYCEEDLSSQGSSPHLQRSCCNVRLIIHAFVSPRLDYYNPSYSVFNHKPIFHLRLIQNSETRTADKL